MFLMKALQKIQILNWTGYRLICMLLSTNTVTTAAIVLQSTHSKSFHVATRALNEEFEFGGGDDDDTLLGLWLLLLPMAMVGQPPVDCSQCSFSALIFLHVVAPRAFAKWSSTELVKTPWAEFCDLMAFHVESPSALAKWSSTEPEERQHTLAIKIIGLSNCSTDK